MAPASQTEATTRLRLDVAYDGTDFTGWATQPGLRTVQGELERWITTVLRLPAPARLTCAGRTDAGVHARGQVAHLDLDPTALPRPQRRNEDDHDVSTLLARRLARVLPGDLVVRSVATAPPGFDARFSAIWRRYVYRLWDADQGPDPLLRRHLAVTGPLDLDRINTAASGLIGLRDFAPFCKRRDGATTIRTLLELEAHRRTEGDLPGLVELTVRADAFCHSMVRSLTGALVAVGTGQRSQDWLTAQAAHTVRANQVSVMPAAGLTLEEVGYPADHRLAERAGEARAVRELEDQELGDGKPS
ncbi:tRNA pseudouridine synthase A [Propionibacteriaceae bacterium Y1685]|uniref:tRNA pseudouridine synthase A n=1 Tax=Microlunatus sp. Y1700 TaxID=3418487 RepID=UPI003B80DFA1